MPRETYTEFLAIIGQRINCHNGENHWMQPQSYTTLSEAVYLLIAFLSFINFTVYWPTSDDSTPLNSNLKVLPLLTDFILSLFSSLSAPLNQVTK